jgi:signal transduction histidine kinase
MKSKTGAISLIFIVIIILGFFTVNITNGYIERAYEDGYRASFEFFSNIAEGYLMREAEFNKIEVDSLKDKGYNILQYYLENNEISLDKALDGLWIFKDSLLSGFTAFTAMENEIFELYNNKLIDKTNETLINIGGNPFNLVNINSDDYNVLLLSKSDYGKNSDIAVFLDSLNLASDMVYLSVTDENKFPLILISRYEDFALVEGERIGVFHFEEEITGGSIEVDFTRELLQIVVFRNKSLLVFIFFLLIVLLSLLLYKFMGFESLDIDDEREARHIEEIGALSSGFSEEIRKHLKTLSRIAMNMDGEGGRVLKDEVREMNIVVDSLKLLIISGIDKKPIDIDNTIGEAISLVDNRDNAVDIKLESVSKLKVEASRNLLVAAFSNIIKNAVEADANKVKVLIRKAGNVVRIIISNNGKEIDREKIRRVFEPFYSDKKQSGLGLFVARKIIEYHGGSVKVESGKETKVDILLPLKD